MSDQIPCDAYAIIIGAMKCGTSSLYDYLQGHPEICPALTKEPEFFSEHQDHGAHVAHYHELWAFDPSSHRYALEASTGYTKYPAEPNVPRNIFNYGIRPKFIYLIRNPFERIASHYNFMQKTESWRLTMVDAHLINTSNYFLQLEQYRPYFPREDFLILDFDDLTANPRRVLERTYDFLGLAHSYFPETYEVVNPTQMRSRFEKQLKRSRFRVLLRFLPKPLKHVGQRWLRAATVPQKRTLTDAEKALIQRELQASMADLHRVYGVNVGKWGFAA